MNTPSFKKQFHNQIEEDQIDQTPKSEKVLSKKYEAWIGFSWIFRWKSYFFKPQKYDLSLFPFLSLLACYHPMGGTVQM